jgi:anti-sigma B factor antagonist
MNLQLDYQNHTGASLLRLSGQLDAASAPVLRTFSQSGDCAGALLLDCSALEFVDSVGLGALVQLVRQSRAAGDEMVLFGLTDRVRRTFEIAHLHQVIALLDDEAAARRWLA